MLCETCKISAATVRLAEVAGDAKREVLCEACAEKRQGTVEPRVADSAPGSSFLQTIDFAGALEKVPHAAKELLGFSGSSQPEAQVPGRVPASTPSRRRSEDQGRPLRGL
jgi:hypothetical protein